MKATAKDLRFHSKEILDTISRGEEVIITYRGHPHAKLIPFSKTKTEKSTRSELFGIWKDNDDVLDVNKYMRDKRKGRFNAY